MSELKSFIVLYDGKFIRVYKKNEADKVIADLIEKNKRLANKDIIMASEAIKEVYKELHRHKYKRCLAMAWWCSAELGMLVSTWESKIKYYKRWQKRWLELAKKFKEAK